MSDPSAASKVWDAELAETYDTTHAGMFDPTVLYPVVEVLAALAAGEPALEFAIGTGRVALPLAGRGVNVSGIELSPHMAAQLAAKPGAEAIDVTIGDMATTRVEGTFGLVYLLFNTIMNVTTQDAQLAVFRNASAHLRPGGLFVMEGGISMGGGRRPQVFAMDDDHIGIDTFDDPLLQILTSHHWWVVDKRLVHRAQTFRYVYPSEMELMATLAGLRLRERWGSWDRAAFTAGSPNHIAVFEKD